MRVEILAVGTELLLGQIANTNARWMSESLAAIGVDVLHHQVVGDNLDRIVEAMRLSAGRADVVIVTGGLGPTQDDITRDALARRDGRADGPPSRARGPAPGEVPVVRPARDAGEQPPSGRCPRGSALPHARREAPRPAWWRICRAATRIYAVPGVPEEMVEMMEGTILPELASEGAAVVRSRVLRCAGIGESALAERVDDLFSGSANPTIAFLASSGEVKVRITAKAATAEAAERLIEPVAEEVRRRLGDDGVHRRRRDARGSRRPPADRRGHDARVRRVDHGWGSGSAHHERAGRVRGLRRVGGRVPERGRSGRCSACRRRRWRGRGR